MKKQKRTFFLSYIIMVGTICATWTATGSVFFLYYTENQVSQTIAELYISYKIPFSRNSNVKKNSSE